MSAPISCIVGIDMDLIGMRVNRKRRIYGDDKGERGIQGESMCELTRLN